MPLALAAVKGGVTPAAPAGSWQERVVRANAKDGRVILTGCNSGFEPFLRNWLASARLLGMTEFVVIALDRAVWQLLGALGMGGHALHYGPLEPRAKASTSWYDLEYRREELRINFLRRGGDPDMFEFYADANGGRRAWPTIPKPSFRDVRLRYDEFQEDQRAWKRARAERIRREEEEARSDRKRQVMHETLKEKARADEAERRKGLLNKNQERLAQARAVEREAEQRALDEKRRREQAAAQRAEQRKQNDAKQQQASSEASGVSDAALRAILAEQEALEQAAAAQGQGSSAWHASTAAPSPEEEARLRAEAEAAERERKLEKDDWIAKAAQKREAKQAKKGKGKGKAPAPAEPAPALPVPPRVDWDEAMANALQQRVQLQDRR